MSASLTRRQALKLGAAASLTTLVAGPSTAARAATGSAPPLLRATYLPLLGQPLDVGGTALRLVAVEDLAGAAATGSLRGHPEAFALTLSGAPGALPAGTHAVRHPRIGTAHLFLAPVGAVADGVQRYEVVVDRSVGVPARPPAPTPGHEPPPDRPGTPEGAAAALTAASVRIDQQAATRRARVTRRERALAKRRAELARRRREALKRRRKPKRRKRAGRARTARSEREPLPRASE